jgi:hypothetical protein
MRRTLLSISRAALAIACAAVSSAAIVAFAARGGDSVSRSVENGGDWYARSPAWYTSRGIFPTEHAPDGSPYAWAGGRVRIQIPRLDRGTTRTLVLRARSGRAPDDPPPLLRITVDGLDAEAVTLGSEWRDVEVPLPVAPRQGATILVDADRTFTPGPQDPRALAFMLDRVTMAGAHVAPSRDVLIDVAVFAVSVALVAIVCLLPAWVAFAAGLLAGSAAAWLVLFDAAFLGEYSRTFVTLGVSIVVVAAIASALARAADPDTRRFWRAAATIAIVVTALKLAVFLHPDAPVSDGMFHVHRAQAVRAGSYIFTSITPRPFYEFPYPIGLYVAAQPLWDRFSDRVALLRAMTLVADAVVAMGLFAAVSRRWGAGTGVVAAGFALAVPIVTETVATANLTNVFAQSCFSLAIVWIGWHLASTRTVLAAAGAAALLSAAFLSHFSTAVVGAPAAVLVATVVALARVPKERMSWRWIAVAVVVSLAASYAIYYSHFHDVYARTLSRVGSGEAADTSLVATLGQHSESKAVTMMRFLLSNYGWAALLLAAAGFVIAVRRDARDGWTLVLLALATTVAAFIALGAFTPIEMRANLAAQPLVAAFAALACQWLWTIKHPAARATAVLLGGATVWIGIAAARTVLG